MTDGDREIDELVGRIEKREKASQRQFAWMGLAIAAAVATTVIASTLQARRNAELRAEQARADSIATALQDSIAAVREAGRLTRSAMELAGRGRISDAIDLYDSALALDASSADAYQLRGYAKLRRHQILPDEFPDDAAAGVVDLEQAVRIDPDNPWSHYNLALAYWETGRQGETVATVRTLLELAPYFRGIAEDDEQYDAIRRHPDLVGLLDPGG